MDVTFNFKSRIRFMMFSELLLIKNAANVCFLELCVIVLPVNFFIPWHGFGLWWSSTLAGDARWTQGRQSWQNQSGYSFQSNSDPLKLKEKNHKQKNHDSTKQNQTYKECSLPTLSEVWSQIPTHCGWEFVTKRYQWSCHKQVVVDRVFLRNKF